MTDYHFIQIEYSTRVALIRLNRPQAMNALNRALLGELMDALAAGDAAPDIGALLITGNKRAFAAGADITEMAASTADEMLQKDPVGIFDAIRQIKKPVIAAVSGYCLGGGCELALSCDLIVASESAQFGQPEIRLGVIPGAGGTQRLARAIGKVLTMEMVLNNRTLSAGEALQLGIVNRVVPVDQYLQSALELAQEIAARAPLAVQAGKRMVNLAFDSLLTEGLAAERRAFYRLFATEDQKEGMAAFLEKRTPQWKGR